MRIVTWNMQGGHGDASKSAPESKWTTDVQRILKGNAFTGGRPDIVCLQECGTDPALRLGDPYHSSWGSRWLSREPQHAKDWSQAYWNLGTPDSPDFVQIAWLVD